MRFVTKTLFFILLSSTALAQNLKKDYSPYGFDLTPNPVLETSRASISAVNYGNSSSEDVPIEAHDFHINYKNK